MTELERKIKEASQLYYAGEASPYTDEEFDAMVELLKQQNPNSELLTLNFGYRVEADSTFGNKYPHKYCKAGSLDKVHNYKELGPNMQKLAEYDASLKLDGLSSVLYYTEGFLMMALTRGNGDVGIDILDKALAINPNLATLPVKFTGAVRGEIVMSEANFKKFKEIHPEAKNARNSAAGLINGKEITDDFKLLNIVFYTIMADESQDEDLAATPSQMRQKLSRMFGDENVVYYRTVHFNDGASMQSVMTDLKQSWYGVYPADGIVLTHTQLEVPNERNNYVYGIRAKAFKFPPELKATTVKEIEWNMSKTHYAVPRVLFEPIELAGTTVQAATGFNAKFIRDNQIAPGAIIEVSKRGEIIPCVEQVLEPVVLAYDETYLPETCPWCGADLDWSGVHLICTNPNCTNAAEQDLLIWLQNIAPTDNLGDTLKMKFINEMIDANMISEATIEDIMSSTIVMPEEGRGAQLDLFGKMWNRLHKEPVTLVSALRAVNIPRLGDITADKLAQYPDTVKELVYSTSDTMSLNQIVNLGKMIGSANATAINQNLNKLRRIQILGNRVDWSKSEVGDRGKVAITGTLSVKRAVFEAELKAAGFTPGDLKKDTKFLITDNPMSGSSKNIQADKWGIPKLTEAQFREQYLN